MALFLFARGLPELFRVDISVETLYKFGSNGFWFDLVGRLGTVSCI